MSAIIRFEDWTDPVPPFEREVVSRLPEDESAAKPPLLFVPGLGHGSWVWTDWLTHAAGRGFRAYAVTPRPGGTLRTHVHDVVQTAASLPRQAVLVGHGAGALTVAYTLGRYPAKAAVLAAPVVDGWTTLGTALRANPAGTLPAIFGGRLGLSRRQLFGDRLPVERADGFVQRLDRVRPRRELITHRPAPDPVGAPPVLVVGSPDDRVVPRASLDRTAARYGGAPLLFPGMGHDLMLDEGWAEPIGAILDWLEKELSSGR
jgi:pimeloyl-ACP methyl ester carboxylesterase